MGCVQDLTDMLAEIIASLAPIPRLPTSDGERRAAMIIRDRFEAAACAARIETVPAYDSYARPLGTLCAAAALAGLLADTAASSTRASGRGTMKGAWTARRAAGFLVGAAAAAGIMDDVTIGTSAARRLLMRRKATTNVIAETGDPDASATLVVLTHHDAAPSGAIFSQHAERWLAARRPDIIESLTSNPPLWWAVVAGPALVAAGSLADSGVLRRAGIAVSSIAAAALADIARRPPVPGANDNLSGVAAALALARELAEYPVRGLRVLLVSAGAEEALQQGIRGFAREHFSDLDRERTWFLTIDTVGSGRLVMLEGEGTMRMHDYGAPFKDLVAGCAQDAGITLLRGLRSHNSTDGCVPHRYGFPTVTLVSVDAQKLVPNYHLYSDIPENVDYRSVSDTVLLAATVARRLAVSQRLGWGSSPASMNRPSAPLVCRRRSSARAGCRDWLQKVRRAMQH
jgi:hypothetical protein